MEQVNQQTGWVSVQDLEHKHLFGTLELASLYGFDSVNEFIGTSFQDARDEIARLSTLWDKQNQEVITQQKMLSYVGLIGNLDNDPQVVICTKTPIKNNSDELLGVYAKCTQLTPNIALQTAMTDLENQISSAHKMQPFIMQSNYPGLSKRQSQCLYFLLLGKQSKQIATYLNITHRTVDTYIEAIKTKMNCYSRSEIISKAHELGLFEIIPIQVS